MYACITPQTKLNFNNYIDYQHIDNYCFDKVNINIIILNITIVQLGSSLDKVIDNISIRHYIRQYLDLTNRAKAF